MANGIFQGSFGDLLNKVRARNESFDDVWEAIERIVIAGLSPVDLQEPLKITWSGRGQAIDIAVDAAADPVALTLTQNGQSAQLGIGGWSIGLIANFLLNRDIFQLSTSQAIQLLQRAASNQQFPGTCLGSSPGAFGSGKLALDQGTISAAPGETMPNATISGYTKVVNGNLWTEGLLTTNLAAPSNGQTGATTATLQTWVPDPSNPANTVTGTPQQMKNGPTITIVNRDTSFSLTAGKYLQAQLVGQGEWRPIWGGC